MASRRRLSDLERLEIVRETLEGVSSGVLAKRFEVTVRTVQYTIHRDKHRKRDSGIRTETVSVTLTPDELNDFDARNRSWFIESLDAIGSGDDLSEPCGGQCVLSHTEFAEKSAQEIELPY